MFNMEPAFPRGSGAVGNSGGFQRFRAALSASGRGRTNRSTKPTTSYRRYGATNFRVQKVARLRPKERHQVMQGEKEIDEAEVQQALTARNLYHSAVRPGMLVLCCIKQISVAWVDVILPGRVRGRLPISNISDAYSKRLQEMLSNESTDCPTLNDLFNIGDLMYMKVIDVPKVRTNVTLSINPRELHSKFLPSQLVPGLVLAAAIDAKEDHGYSMDVGIRNVRAFLPDANLGENQTDIGRILVCSVELVSQLNGGATIVLKAFNPHAPRLLNVEEASLETIVPGCRLTFTVGEPVKYGLRGMLFDDMVPAYVNELMLTKVTSTPQKYRMFKKIPATLLYVMPHTKQVFVSLRPYPNNRVTVAVPNVPGTIIENACVKSVDGMGVWFQFGAKHRGLLPRIVLMDQAAKAGNVDESVVMGNFPIGTTHKICVIHHNPFLDLYTVSNDPEALDAEVRSEDDIVIGNLYNCRVIRFVGSIVYVKVGFAVGTLGYELYDRTNPLKLNETILMRAVLRLNDTGSIRFTNHPKLLSKDAIILQDWNQLDKSRKKQSFHGVVYRKTWNQIYVRFFNNMCGILFTSGLNTGNDPAKVAQLQVGSVEKFTVKAFDKANNTIKLLLPYDKHNVNHVLVDATVTCIHAAGVDVRIGNGETGTIPSECFSQFGEHNSLYTRLIQEGETISVVKTNPGTYSFRLTDYIQKRCMQIESVKKGDILKGSCITANGVLYTTPLLSNYSDRIQLTVPGQKYNVRDGSIIMMRVHNVQKTEENGYRLEVRTALKDVCLNGIGSVEAFVVAYKSEVDDLILRYKEKNHAFANYTIGEHVECLVERVVPDSEKLAVEVYAVDKKHKHPAKGIATIILPNTPASSYKVGTKVPGRVVWIDVERMLVHVCVDQPLFERIGFRGLTGSSKIYPDAPQDCWVLFENNFVQVCCLQSGLVQLLIVPVKHHYNDWTSTASLGNTTKVKLIERIGMMVFAMQRHNILTYGSFVCSKQTTQPRVNSTWQKKSSSLLIRCRPTPEVLNEDADINYSDQSENESEDNVQQGEMNPANKNGNDGDEADTSYGIEYNIEDSYYNDDGLDGSEITNGTHHQNETVSSANSSLILVGKKSKLNTKPAKNGKVLSKLKRKLADEEHEKTNGERGQMLPIKKQEKQKKKKILELSSMEDQEMATTVLKLPKKLSEKTKKDVTQQKKNKKSILFVGKTAKAVKTNLKKKASAFEIDQLDGAQDFYLHQLDGMEDGQIGISGSKQTGAKKRKHADAPGLPGATSFWDSTPVYKRSTADSSDDAADSSDDEQGEAVPKKRTAKERFEAMKQEEERLRKIEEELANPSVDPHTPDQFDRLVLAQPNNSMLWIRYMAFHMESAELEKARAVGRKALKAIHFREETDRLNVWIALLNLEIRYETVDSFKDVLQEAIQYNDAFKVYSRVIDILIDCQKDTEVQDLLELLLKKFRKQNDMWYLVADAWYRIGQGSKVKPLLSQALKSLPTRDHIPLIVKFAFLHNRNENRDEAHLLFEQILTSYPKRTDIWSQYIDMLVKDNLVGNARQILERAIMQRLPMKNMKTLYTKYVNFEEKHGDRDSVRRVKQMAADYVQAQLNNAGIKG